MTVPKVRLLHETNPQKYFPAIYDLADQGRIALTGAHRYSVAKEWLRSGLRDRTPVAQRTRQSADDAMFRLSVGRISGETIVIGFAPWDWRLLIYARLAGKNRILYHTSWHDWRPDRTPRQPPAMLKPRLQQAWQGFLQHPNVETIAVTPAVAASLSRDMGVGSTVIPHSVPDVFFQAGAARTPARPGPLRLLYVGEVSEKKGIGTLLDLLPGLAEHDVHLTVIGDGAMAARVREAGANITFLGPIWDRAELAQQMARHDVLMLLSRRTQTWEELFGIVIVEAIAAGMGVLASDHIGPQGILDSVGSTGLFDENDTGGVVRELQRLAQDPDALAAFVARQAPVAEQYRINAVSDAWMDRINGS